MMPNPIEMVTVATRAWRITQAVMNLLVFALFALLVYTSYVHYRQSGTLRALGLLVVSTLFVALYSIKRPAKTETEDPGLWVLGIAGTAAPLLMRVTDAAPESDLGEWIQIGGCALIVASLLSLRRSFAVVPANRGVRAGGMYRLVRHPVYLAELIMLTGFAVSNPTGLNAAILLAECGLQFARACAEERLLLADPQYSAYCRRVRYRLVPGLI